jgi:basic membrane protein A
MFAIIDTVVTAPNVASVTFRELDGDFLAGALSALLSKTNKVAFLGGADTDVIRRIQDGWTQGVKYVSPQATLLAADVGGKDDFAGFNNPQAGLAAALKLFQQGADVMYVAAGRTGLGGIQAGLTLKKLVITSGSDQRYLAPGVVVTSRLKNVNVAVLGLVSDLVKGSLRAGQEELNYKSGGVGLAPTDGGLVPAEVQAKFDAIKADLESGKIVLKYTGP